jgi:hypothetical protein
VTPTDTLVLYPAAVGSVVSNSRNDHSLFVTELLKEIRTPSVSAEQALRNTQAGVSSATNREQVPWLSSSLTSEFSFSGGVPFAPSTKASARVNLRPKQASRSANCQSRLTHRQRTTLPTIRESRK